MRTGWWRVSAGSCHKSALLLVRLWHTPSGGRAARTPSERPGKQWLVED